MGSARALLAAFRTRDPACSRVKTLLQGLHQVMTGKSCRVLSTARKRLSVQADFFSPQESRQTQCSGRSFYSLSSHLSADRSFRVPHAAVSFEHGPAVP